MDSLFNVKNGHCIERLGNKDHFVEIWENRRFRWLTFDGSPTVQSAIDIEYPLSIILEYQAIMLASLYFVSKPKKVLNLGLGGGNLVKALNHLLPDSQLDVVEVDPLVIAAAQQYFGVPVHNKIKIYREDAVQFTMNATVQYSCIFIDLFLATNLVPATKTIDFYKGIYQLLAPHGVAVFNLWSYNPKELATHITYLRKAFHSRTFLIQSLTRGNKIFFAWCDPQYVKCIDKMVKENRLSDLSVDSDFGYMGQGLEFSEADFLARCSSS